MKIEFEYTEEDLKKLILADVSDKLGEFPLDDRKLTIMVKSKQNWKSEWEMASFKAEYKS